MDKLSKKQKVIISSIGLLIVFILMGNSNNIPETYADRVFKPISRENATFYYSGIMLMIITVFCLTLLNKVKETKLLKTGVRRVVVTFILIGIFPTMWGGCNIFFKGFSKDLNSIYLYRDRTNVSIYGDENGVSAFGQVYIKNCSNETQKFYLKIKVPSIASEDINEEYFTVKHEFRLPPKEERRISINEELTLHRQDDLFGYNATVYEYVLFNDNEQVVFKGTVDDYKYDNYEH